MSILVTPLGANAIDGAFGGTSPWLAGSSVTLGTGDVVVFIVVDSALAETVTGVTVGGVSATSVGTTTDTLGSAWLAQNVNTATGNVSIALSGTYNLISANWFLITGENPTPVFSFVSNQSFATTDPQPITPSGAGVPAGGAGLVMIAATPIGANKNPTTWTGCVTSGNTTLEAYASTGNQITAAGNYTTTSGTGALSASGAVSYAFANSEMMMLAFGPSGPGDILQSQIWM